ncbi:MAG: neutral/alkaline non-lysosomal ceramidase N-terminal domain-containing protein [bacterium]
MKIGFGRSDVTPRVGVELSGFGPYICRHSVGVRDRLWARAMACEQGGKRWVLVSCDLIGMELWITRRVRDLVHAATGLPPDALMLHCTHTHSGPNTGGYIGWGAPDEPYLLTVSKRIAKAAIAAITDLREAIVSLGEAPCEGIGHNREYDPQVPPLDQLLDPAWRPAKPELTDTVCRVFKVESAGKIIGFMSYFGCHPVVCCAESHWIHGDYCGVATNILEREMPGATGMFLQGAQGDVNTCVAHQTEPDSLRALDVIAARYAAGVRRALAACRPVAADTIGFHRRTVTFTRKPWDLAHLKKMLAEKEAFVTCEATDDDYKGNAHPDSVRMNTVYLTALRRLVARGEQGLPFEEPTEIQGLRLGPVVFVGSPFETFQAIKNDVVAGSPMPVTLVMSFCNDSGGYATDHTAAVRGGYAADMVPLIMGVRPFASIHDELVKGLLDVAGALA